MHIMSQLPATIWCRTVLYSTTVESGNSSYLRGWMRNTVTQCPCPDTRGGVLKPAGLVVAGNRLTLPRRGGHLAFPSTGTRQQNVAAQHLGLCTQPHPQSASAIYIYIYIYRERDTNANISHCLGQFPCPIKSYHAGTKIQMHACAQSWRQRQTVGPVDRSLTRPPVRQWTGIQLKLKLKQAAVVSAAPTLK